MKYKLKVYSIMEDGQRTDAQGNPHQEDCIFPYSGQYTDADRVFVLCDGMGGHDAGEVASATVCLAMGRSALDSLSGAGDGVFTDDMLGKAVADAYDALDAKDSGAEKKMGTTMTFLALHEGGATVAHMGDSRVYQFRPGADAAHTRIMFHTEDHSLVNDLVRIGDLTPEEARVSPQKNIITRAMQPNMERRSKADIAHLTDIKAGDYFYMCTDGMLEQMDDSNLCFNFSDLAGDAENKVDILTKATMENRDNHTAFIIHILDVEGEPAPQFAATAQPPKSGNCIMAELEDGDDAPADATVGQAEAAAGPQPQEGPAAAYGSQTIRDDKFRSHTVVDHDTNRHWLNGVRGLLSGNSRENRRTLLTFVIGLVILVLALVLVSVKSCKGIKINYPYKPTHTTVTTPAGPSETSAGGNASGSKPTGHGGKQDGNAGGSHSGNAGGSHSGNAGGSHSGNAGGSHSGNAGGSHSGNAGGSHSGNAGGSHSGNAGGSHSGNAGGSHSGNAGGSHSGNAGGSHSGNAGGSHSGNAGGSHSGGDKPGSEPIENIGH